MKIINFFKDIINKVENNNIPLSYFIITFLSAVTLRNSLEILATFDSMGFIIFIHYYLSYIFLAAMLIFLVFILTKFDIIKIIKLILTGFFILIIVPILDFIISNGKGYGILYLIPGKHDNLLLRFFTFFGDQAVIGGVTPGVRIEIALVLLFFFFYFYIKKINFYKNIINVLLIYVLLFSVFSLPFFFEFLSNLINIDYILGSKILAHFYLLGLFIIFIFLSFIKYKEIFVSLIKDIRPFRLFHYELMFIFGIVLSFTNSYFILDLNILFKFIVIGISIIFAWIYSIITNNIIDYDIDKISNKNRPLIKSKINIKLYKKIGWLFLILSLIYASIDYLAFFIIVLFLGNYFLYSMPPLRLKRITFLSKIFISLNSLFLVLLGFFISGGEMENFPKNIIWFFLIIFTAVINFIDIKDYEGDKHEGIKTLPVVFGLKRSKKIIGIFFIITYLSVYFLIKNSLLLLPLFLLSCVHFYLLNKNEYKEKPVFLVYLLSLIFFIMYFIIFNISL